MSNAKKFFGLSSPFAERLKLLFFNSGETQEQVANRFNVTRQGFGNWLNGRTQPDYDALCKLAEYYKVSTDYLLGRTDVKTPDTELKTVCEVTNLSEAAAKKIIKLNEKENQSDIDYSDMLFNQMIESPEFDEIVNVLYTALCFRHLALPDKEVIEQVNKEIETNRNSPFWQYALATAKGGLSPYYKQQLSELICKFYDRINQEYLSEDEKYMQSKGENDNG